MNVTRTLVERPYFSICIPQHNRTSFLIEVCRSLDAQRFRNFELCISDDCSSDGRGDELLSYLHTSGLSFSYRRLENNLRYDGNLRSAMALAKGQYAFLLGNDDGLKDPRTLQDLYDAMAAMPAPIAVAFTNFEDFSTGHVTRRVQSTSLVGSGPAVAAAHFRKFSFVGGVILATEPAHAAAVERWDRSEMYQMYIGCRLIAEGGNLAEIDLVTVRKDVQIPGEIVDSFARKPRVELRGIPVQTLPLCQTARLVIDAIEPSVAGNRTKVFLPVILQYFGFLYPYWLLQYRRVQSWRFAAGLSRGMQPRRSLSDVRLSLPGQVCATVIYAASTIIGLTIPVFLLDGIQRPAARVARAVSQWSAGVPESR
jgi:glycosyltransferase involved in cell wall biosynthesis